MFEKLRKRIMFVLCVGGFLAMVWAIKEYGIYDAIEGFFKDPGAAVPDVNINR